MTDTVIDFGTAQKAQDAAAKLRAADMQGFGGHCVRQRSRLTFFNLEARARALEILSPPGIDGPSSTNKALLNAYEVVDRALRNLEFILLEVSPLQGDLAEHTRKAWLDLREVKRQIAEMFSRERGRNERI